MSISTANNSNGKGPINWNIWISLTATVISVIALGKSCKANDLAREANMHASKANEIAQEQLEVSESEFVLAITPYLSLSYYPAQDLELIAEEDTYIFDRLGIEARPIKTSYWRHVFGQHQDETSVRYLFVLVANHGQGTAISLDLDLQWSPKDGYSTPDGLTDWEGDNPNLYPGQALALLVDVLDSHDPSQPLEAQNAIHFDNIEIQISYEDISGQRLNYAIVKLPDIPPAYMMR